jgi:hypothetical protein
MSRRACAPPTVSVIVFKTGVSFYGFLVYNYNIRGTLVFHFFLGFGTASLDNASTHKSKILKEWLKDNKHKIEIFYLPSYSPDLNPDERVNADVKYGVGSKHPRRTREELRATTEAHLMLLKENPGRIRRYFLDPIISYAS